MEYREAHALKQAGCSHALLADSGLELLRQASRGLMPENRLVPMHKESFDEEQIAALVNGDLQACFGSAFADLGLKNAVGLPAGRMKLVHRILELDPNGGRFGIGQITGEDRDPFFSSMWPVQVF